MGFDSGFNMGRQIGQQRIDNERRAKLDARQAELDKRADAEFNEREAAWKAYRDNAPVAPVRVDPEQASAPTSFQVNTTGLVANPQGYRSQAGTFGDGSDTGTYSMPSTGGMAGPINAQGLTPPPQQDYVGELSRYRRALNDRDRNLALGLRDRAGIAAANEQEHVLNKQDIFNEVARMPKSVLDKFGPGANISDIPVIYLGKDKNGYMVQMTDADGEPGKKFTLNEAQMRQFALANKLAEAGYGTDAMAALNSAHKELGAHIGTWNSMQNDAAKISNDAKYKADSVEIARSGEQAKAGYYRSQTPVGLSDEANAKITRLEEELDDPKTTPERRRAITTSINSALAKEQRAGRGGRIGFMPYEPNQPGGASAGKKTAAELRYELGNIWQDTAKGMRIAGQGEKAIAEARDGFFAEQGFAPDRAIKDLFNERDPQTGERRTRKDLDSFNRMFPNSAVDPAQIPWLNKVPTAPARTTKPPEKGGLRLNYGPVGDAVTSVVSRIPPLPRGDYPGREADEKAAFSR